MKFLFTSIINKKVGTYNNRHPINLNKNEFINLLNLTLGLYYPLNMFCNYNQYRNIILHSKLDKKNNWTIPIMLTLKKEKKFYENNQTYPLKYLNKIVGFINIDSFYSIDKKLHNKKIFGTNKNDHPGVLDINKTKNNFVGGEVFLLKKMLPKDKFFFYNQPKLMRSIYKNNSAVFSTRNICHKGHSHIHKNIMRSSKSLTICIIETVKNKFESNDIIKSYSILKKKSKLYEKISIIKILLPRLFAGPKEAYLQAIIFNNLRFKSFSVGRDHAGVGNFYSKYSSQRIFNKLNNLKIKILKSKEPRLCPKCGKINFLNKKICKIKKHQQSYKPIDGTFIRNILKKKKIW